MAALVFVLISSLGVKVLLVLTRWDIDAGLFEKGNEIRRRKLVWLIHAGDGEEGE